MFDRTRVGTILEPIVTYSPIHPTMKRRKRIDATAILNFVSPKLLARRMLQAYEAARIAIGMIGNLRRASAKVIKWMSSQYTRSDLSMKSFLLSSAALHTKPNVPKNNTTTYGTCRTKRTGSENCATIVEKFGACAHSCLY